MTVPKINFFKINEKANILVIDFYNYVYPFY